MNVEGALPWEYLENAQSYIFLLVFFLSIHKLWRHTIYLKLIIVVSTCALNFYTPQAPR